MAAAERIAVRAAEVSVEGMVELKELLVGGGMLAGGVLVGGGVLG